MGANSRQDILYDWFDTVIREVDGFIVKPVSADEDEREEFEETVEKK